MVANLERQIAAVYPTTARSTAYQKIQKATGISLSSLQRIMSGTTGPSIDTLADLAHHLGTTVSELLTPVTEMLPVAHGPSTGTAAQRLQRRRA